MPENLRPGLFRLMAISVGTVVANLYYAQPLLPDLAREFHLSVTATGAVAMLGMAGAGIGQLIFVPLGDIRERRRLIVSMIAAAAVALAFMASAQNAAWLMFATFACGVSASVNHITTPYAAHLAPAGQRGRVVGTVISGLLIGVLVSRTYSGWVGEVFGWRAVFASATLLMIAMAILMRRWLPEGPPESSLTWPQLMASVIPLWRTQPVLRQAVLVNTLMFGAFSGFWTAMVFFVEGPPYNYTSRGAGLFGLIGAAGALCAPLAGRLTDRSGGHKNVLYAIYGVMLAFAILGLFGTNLAGFILGVIILDLAQQFGHVSNQTRIYGLVPEARSRLNMVYMTCSFSGAAAGSYLSTYWWHRAGWTGVCIFSIALMIAALAIWWRSNPATLASRADLQPASAPKPL
ncbi:MAG: MFS transporter [Acidobacteriota bacterium]